MARADADAGTATRAALGVIERPRFAADDAADADAFAARSFPATEFATPAAALESKLRAIRAGAVAKLAFDDVNASRGACFTTFHFVAEASDAFSAPLRAVTGITPCARFNAVLP
jgi:hypothetical protein